MPCEKIGEIYFADMLCCYVLTCNQEKILIFIRVKIMEQLFWGLKNMIHDA